MVDTPFRKISEEIGEAVRETLHRVGQDASGYSDRARHALDRSRQRAAEALDDLAHETSVRGRKAAKYAVREVREHPIATIAIGVALGAAVTALLLSSRRR